MDESLHQMALRIADGKCGNGCYNCEANVVRKSGACIIRRLAQCNNADEQIDFVVNWAQKNPPSNYPSWEKGWKIMFPNSVNGAFCPKNVFGERYAPANCTVQYNACDACRKRRMPEEIAKKLGIEKAY